MRNLGLYVHIPFCKSKCYYCDFKSYSNKMNLIDKYISYLKREIDVYSERINEYYIDTIFIGGGTPSFIEGEYIYEIYNHLDKRLNLSRLQEVTIEANPKTLDDEKLQIYKKIGINRISLGLQSLNNRLLNRIGRVHTAEDFYQSFELIKKWGYTNINVDIMFNLPGQTIEDVLNTLKGVIELDVEHISFYSLKVEEGTPFFLEYQNSKLNLPDEDTERDMYHKGIELLKKNGYKHYEISNLSKPGYQCRHNLKYWRLEPYIGIGLGSHSNINSKRYYNYSDFTDYFSLLDSGKLPVEGTENIDTEMEIAEYVILGLRLVEGVDKQDFFSRFNKSIDSVYGNKFTELTKQGLLINSDNNVRLTDLGLDLSNWVFRELLP